MAKNCQHNLLKGDWDNKERMKCADCGKIWKRESSGYPIYNKWVSEK